MLLKIYEFIFIIASFLYLLFAFFLFTNKKGNRLNNYLLAAFCVSQAIVILSALIYIYRNYIYQFFPTYIDIVFDSSYFILGPLIYFYIRSVIYKNLEYRYSILLHLLPFLIDFIFRNIKYFSQENIRELLFDPGYFITYSELIARLTLIDVHIILYLIAALVVMFKYRSNLKNIYSGIDKLKLSWLYFVLVGMLIVQISSLLKHSVVTSNELWANIFGIFMHVGTLMFVTVIIIKALRNSDLFLKNENSFYGKYAKTALPENKMKVYLEKLTNYMKNEKPYLNPSLNINDLSEILSIPSYHISQILNQKLNQNFYQFVNSYRINEFKRIIKKEPENNQTVLEVLYESGFQSKSTFNRIFKQQTGVTPTHFIKSLQYN